MKPPFRYETVTDMLSQTETNKALVRRFVEEVVNQGNLALVDELVAPDFVSHSHGIEDRDAYRQLLADLRTAFPDLQMEIEQLIAEGEWVALRGATSHTHEGPFMGIPATGTHGSHSGMAMVRVVDGRIVEFWEEADMLGLLQQLGAFPAGEPG